MPDPSHRPRARRRWPDVLLAPVAVCLACAWPALAPAQSASGAAPHAVRAYAIPAGPLSEALSRFALEAGIALSFEPARVQHLRSAGLDGSYPVEDGFRRLLAGTGLAAVPLAAGRYTLQAAPASAPPVTELLPLTVTATADAVPAGAVSVRTLRREELDRFAGASTADLLRDISGLTVANSRNGAGLDVNIRGMQGFGRVKVLVDGTDASSTSYKGYGGESSRAFVDPELLSEVKVEKGPNTGPYGAGVVGGVVSMNTLTANDLIREGRNVGLRLRGTWSNNSAGPGTYAVIGPGADGSAAVADAIVRDVTLPHRAWTGSLAAAWRPNDTLELVAGLSRRRHGNYASGSRGDVTGRLGTITGTQRLSFYKPGEEVFNTSQDTESALLKAGFKLPHQQRLDVGFSYLDSVFGETRSAGYQDYIQQVNPSSARKKLYTAKYAWTPDTPWINLNVNVWKADSHEYQANDIRGIAMLGGVHRAQYADTRGKGMEIWNTSLLEILGTALELRYGATWLHEDVGIQPLDGGIYMDPNGKRTLRSQFAQAEWSPWSSLTLQAGLRRESYDVEGDGEVPSGINGQARPLHIKHGERRTNPTVGARWQATRALQVFGRYSEGWRPPSAKETINGLLADANTSRTLLKPEFVRSTEFGARLAWQDVWRTGDRAGADLTFFRNRTQDYIYGFAGAFQNAESADIRGWELNASYDAGTFFARYAYTRYTHAGFCGVTLAFDAAPPCFEMPFYPRQGWDISMSGLYVPPKAQHSLTVGARLLERRLQFGMRVSGARDHADAEGTAATGWRAYTVYDLFGSYRIDKRLTVSLSVENLTDRFYLDATTNAMLAVPAPGRTARVSLTYAY